MLMCSSELLADQSKCSRCAGITVNDTLRTCILPTSHKEISSKSMPAMAVSRRSLLLPLSCIPPASPPISTRASTTGRARAMPAYLHICDLLHPPHLRPRQRPSCHARLPCRHRHCYIPVSPLPRNADTLLLRPGVSSNPRQERQTSIAHCHQA